MEEDKQKLSGRLGIKYEIISAVVLANPGKEAEFLAEKCNMEVGALQRVLSKEEFQKVLSERRERVCGQIIKEAQLANHQLHLKAVEKAQELLPEMQEGNVIKLLDVTGKNGGLQKDKALPQVAINNSFVVRWMSEEGDKQSPSNVVSTQ